ncbi:hypothetical protein SDC9_181276 [bioreactor metagenome]|uniref:Uncharacterized protein n=1 Tax=bioreactor metagenome TaxID=1076179 RepID=A0A645HCG7_9ZZZZ
MGIFIATPQHQQFESLGAILLHSLRVDFFINHYAIDRNSVTWNKLISGHNHGAAFGNGVLLYNLTVAELLIDQNGGGIGGQDLCRIDFEIGQHAVIDRGFCTRSGKH